MAIVASGSPSKYSGITTSLGEALSAPPTQGDSSLLGRAVGVAEKVVKESVAKKTADFVAEKIPVLGRMIVGTVQQNYQEQQSMEKEIDGIKALAEQGVLGYSYKEVVIDGVVRRVAVDASAQLDNTNAEPRVLVSRPDEYPSDDPSRQQRPLDLNDPQLAPHISAMKSYTSAGVAAYKEQLALSLPERKKAYLKEMDEYAQNVAKASPEDIGNLTPPQNRLGNTEAFEDLLKEKAQKAQKEQEALLAARNDNAPKQQQPAFALAAAAP